MRICLGSIILIACVCLLEAATWDRAGAQRALNEARALRDEIAGTPKAPQEKYQVCVQRYRLVYLKDPHFSGCPDAIYEQAVLYSEMGDRFGLLEGYERAAKLFRFLISDYGGSRLCPDALLRLGDLYAGPLEDQSAAQQAYQQLRTKFRSSKAAATLAAKKTLPREESARKTEPPAVTAPSDGDNRPGSYAAVQNIRYWTTTDYTRVAIEMKGEARYDRFRLSNPDRIYFDISNARLSHDLLNHKFVVGDEFLKQVRVAQNRVDVVRVVLDFAQVSDYSVFELHDPFRVIIDIYGARAAAANSRQPTSQSKPKTDERGEAAPRQSPPSTEPRRVEALSRPETAGLKAENAPPKSREALPQTAREQKALTVKEIEPVSPVGETKPAPETSRASESQRAKPSELMLPPLANREPAVLPKVAAPTSRGDRTLTRILGLKIGRIVLDPGHGGHDTGTIGPGGLMEKTLVLDVARNLRKLLEEQLGAEVFLTRDDDSFISLEERTAIANQHRADLFISIHANSSNVQSISGVETYFLDFARTASERAVAARENASTVRNIRDLENMIKNIAQADKSAESRELAAMIQKKLYSGIQKLFPSVRNRGVRSAPFVVLIGANMPSALAEVAFISNPRDENLLKKEGNREHLAKALFAGIEGYMKTLGIDVAQNQSGSN